MKNHFFISYAGNKRQEVERIVDNLDLTEIDTVIESYCGTSAFSFYLWKTHPKGRDLKYILNDNDENLIAIYNIIKNGKFEDFLNTVESVVYDKDGVFISKEEYTRIIKENDPVSWFIAHKFYNHHIGMYPQVNKSKTHMPKKGYCDDFVDFLQTANVEIKNMDAVALTKEHEENAETLIFLDPPYIAMNNDYYQCGGDNIYEYVSLRDIECFKAKICFVINDTWISRLIFKKWNIIRYNKRYDISNKRKVIHMIITN
jgi:site-specific DNA-adenine methylase